MLQTEDHKPKRFDTAQFHAQAVQRVISAIRARLDDSISLKEMAAVAYMSRFHFNRTFRRVTGLPPRRFLSALRVQAATHLLLDTDQSVTDICLDVGYNSLGAFNRRFSSVLGISPMKLREMQQPVNEDLLMQSEVDAQKPPAQYEPLVTGRTQAPLSFSGPIFVGLFATAIPEGAPLACAIQRSPGPFQIRRARPGRQYLFAIGLPSPDSIDDYFKHDAALRGGGIPVHIDKHKGTVECGDICLRAAMPTDPPILVNLPGLLSKMRRLCKAA